MKKMIALILLGVMLFTISACGEKPSPAEPAAPAETAEAAEALSAEVLQTERTAESPEPLQTSVPSASEADTSTIDVDLTQLSSTMVYSEVYAMMYEPEQYIGKTVKMNGLFSTMKADDGKMYFACVVQDATACCAQGLEFEPKDSYVFPDDYPDPGDDITVVGIFDTYEEEYGGDRYMVLILRDAELL
ncbi:MAG: hypothetical protein K6C08_15865 [Oscillospiraceae bacterium]|nr:hypothetical protein [Oscillospiraceae bacterium]